MTMMGTMTTMIQAPMRNLETMTTIMTMPVAMAPTMLRAMEVLTFGFFFEVVADHAGLGEGEAGEDADGVEGGSVWRRRLGRRRGGLMP